MVSIYFINTVYVKIKFFYSIPELWTQKQALQRFALELPLSSIHLLSTSKSVRSPFTVKGSYKPVSAIN